MVVFLTKLVFWDILTTKVVVPKNTNRPNSDDLFLYLKMPRTL